MNSTTRKAVYSKRIDGLTKYAEGTKRYVLAGDTYSMSVLVTRYSGAIQAIQTTETKRTEYLESLEQRNVALEALAPIDEALVGNLRSVYGKSSQTLADFGVSPMKKTKKSAQTKADAAAKAKATRAGESGTGSDEAAAQTSTSTAGAVAATKATP